MGKNNGKTRKVLNATVEFKFDADTKRYHRCKIDLTKEQMAELGNMIINIDPKGPAAAAYQPIDGEWIHELNVKFVFIPGIENKK